MCAMGKKGRFDVYMCSFGALCLFLGAMVFFFGAGGILVNGSSGFWNTAVYAYRAIYLAFGNSAPYTETGFVLPKIAFVLYLISFFGFFVALSYAVQEGKKKRSGVVLLFSCLGGMLSGLLFLFAHFEIPVSEGYMLLPGEGYVIPGALGIAPGLAYSLRYLVDRIPFLKEENNG